MTALPRLCAVTLMVHSLAQVTLVSMTSTVTIVSVIKLTNALMVLTHVRNMPHVPMFISHVKMACVLQNVSLANVSQDSVAIITTHSFF